MSAICRIILFTMLAVVLVSEVWAQESLPNQAEPTTEPTTHTDQTERIVDGRPPLYSLKRAAHPLTWLELAFEPAFRLAESGRLQSLAGRKPKTDKISGIRFGAGSAGTSSGFGPRVTFFHKDLLHRGISVEVPLLYTYSQYQVYQFKASTPLASQTFVDGLNFDLEAGYISRARDNFFGIGNDTPLPPEERQLRTVTRGTSAGFTAKLSDNWTSGLHFIYRNVGVTKPTTGHSAQGLFTSASTPGLFGATIASAVFSIGHDNEVVDNYAFKGGSDLFEVSFNRSPGGGEFTYWRYRFDSQHFFWLTDDGRKVIAARGMAETNHTPVGRLVPWFDMPFLAADQTLRGFDSFRFRDKSALALSLEYRYRIWPALDWGLFIDEGQVAPQLGDMALNCFHTGYGVRLFVWPKPNLPLSIDYGRSNETWRLYFNINTRF
jgi:outer membrane protein assembly factor BamA